MGGNEMSKYYARMKKHDKFESDIMEIMRPFTSRRHMPDRFVSFNGHIVAWDAKTTKYVEDNSYDEYFRLQSENNIPVFIVWQVDDAEIYAEWIDNISWHGPYDASPNSTSGDDYYIMYGGKTLKQFLSDSKNYSPETRTQQPLFT
jgi:hypothetical protein